jgi:putative hydrolase of the HAD superfamily
MSKTPGTETGRPAGDPAAEGRARIRAVVFDYGNVLCLPQPASDLERMAALCGIPLDRFKDRYWRFRLPYDRGELDAASYWASVTREDSRSFSGGEVAEIMDLDVESWSHPNRETLAWAEQLKNGGLGVAVLSNMPCEVGSLLIERCNWLGKFNPVIYSCTAGSAKPEARIYEYCLEKLNREPEEILFLDDRAENVRAAAALGIHSLVFDTIERTSAQAAHEFGLPAWTQL